MFQGRELVLASASPRRRELLAGLGVAFTVCPADIDETPRAGEAVARFVARMAREKAGTVAGREVAGPVLAADTVVVCDELPFGKPRDREDALAMLGRLSGRWHRVLSAVCLVAGDVTREVLTETEVRFRPLARGEAAAYWATGEPCDKAGAYAIQGLGGCLVQEIRGSYSGVVGLPLAETLGLLRSAGIPCGPGGLTDA
ncbi:MAG: septum formation inhibitor Maf [Gammaproteobacteria bacterium]|nr:septum formation inhibitor Maf [Gammaproteobacteria bacterium]